MRRKKRKEKELHYNWKNIHPKFSQYTRISHAKKQIMIVARMCIFHLEH